MRGIFLSHCPAHIKINYLVTMVTLAFGMGCSTLHWSPGATREIGDYESNVDDLETGANFIPSGEDWPPFQMVPPVNQALLTQKFSPTRNRAHQGVDLAGRKRQPIFSAHAGRVIYAGKKFRGYGKMVIVEYNKKWATLYAHLNKIKVKTGQKVKPHHVLGLMGRTGRATGVHLHFELLREKTPIDPLPLFGPRFNRKIAKRSN